MVAVVDRLPGLAHCGLPPARALGEAHRHRDEDSDDHGDEGGDDPGDEDGETEVKVDNMRC